MVLSCDPRRFGRHACRNVMSSAQTRLPAPQRTTSRSIILRAKLITEIYDMSLHRRRERILLMNLRQFEILRAVMRTRSTVAAAQNLGMSQPAVSNAIKHAESALGFLLFDRVNKRMIPTQEAQILLAEAEPLFLMQ